MANDRHSIKQLGEYRVFLPPAGAGTRPGVEERRAARIKRNNDFLQSIEPTAPKMHITGSFIYAHPPNYRGAETLHWTQYEWKRELTRLKGYGIDTVIFQASLWAELEECYYPSQLFKDYKSWNVVEPMLAAAKELGLVVFLGGYGSVTCWRERLSGQMIQEEIQRQVGCFKELLRYRASFDGFYFSPESAYIGKRDEELEDFLGELYHGFFSVIRNADPRLKILMSPATIYHQGAMGDMRDAWCRVFAKDHPDILAPQDSIGCGCITLDRQDEAFKIWRSVADDRQIELWSNVEDFECCAPYYDETSRRAAAPERVIAQINNAAPYVSKLISWELLYYGNAKLHPAGIPMIKALFPQSQG